MKLELEEPGGTRSVATADVSTGTLSTARIQEAMSKVDAPAILANTGAERIHGRVLDPNGQPVQGVELVAKGRGNGGRNVYSRANSWQGAPETKTLEQQMTEAAEAWAKSRANRHLARTDANGNFTLDHLTKGIYDLRAYKENWSINCPGQYEALTGSTMEFTALPVSSLTLDVRMPDGSVATDVVIQSARDERNAEFLAWSAEEPTLRFKRSSVTLTAYSGVSNHGYLRKDPQADFSSEAFPIDFTAPQVDPLVIQLTGTNGITGAVTWEVNNPDDQSPEVVASRIESAATFDESLPVEAHYSEFLRDGKFHFSKMEPGTYAVGVTNWRTGIFLSGSVQIVEVADSIVPVNIHVMPPSSEGYLVLTCRDQNGEPVAIERVSYNYESATNGGSGGLDITAGANDTYLVSVKDIRRLNYMDWPAGTSVSILVNSKVMGSMPAMLRSGQLSLNLTFAEPFPLTVTLAGYEACPKKSQLSVSLHDASLELDRPLQVSSYGRRLEGISEDGTMTFPAVAAGTWEVSLSISGTRLDSKIVTIANSGPTVQLNVPTLYEQTISAPTLSKGATLSLSLVAEETHRFGNSQELNADKRCRFSGLIAGTYEIQYYGGGKRAAPVRIEVPGPEFVFEAKSPNALVVKIHDHEGTLYRDGFRDGDIMTHVNSKTLADLESLDLIYADFMTGDADVQVLRGGATVLVTMSKIEMTQRPESQFGGTFEPTFLD